MNKRDKTKYLPVLKRIKLTNNGLKLCFINKGKQVWYNINYRKGIIEVLNQKKFSKIKYHFALKNIGNARSKLFRGNQDILIQFVKNAMSYYSIQDPNYLNDIDFRELIWGKLNELTGILIKRLDINHLKQARSFSRRHAICWEIFGLLRSYPKNSIQILRLESFAKLFPSLLEIIYPGFLSKYIIPGKSLKNIPYWSKFFRSDAMVVPKNYKEAKFKMMRAVLKTLGIPPEADEESIKAALAITHFNLPFLKQPRFKEAYVVWMLKQNEFDSHDFRTYYDYIRSEDYIVNRYTTIRSLEKRHHEWMFTKFDERVNCNILFPSPWLSSNWNFNDYNISFISNLIELKLHSILQKNCSFSFQKAILAGKVQLYALKFKKQLLGTIEVIKNEESLTLGQCAGYKNNSLNKQQLSTIQQWFLHNYDILYNVVLDSDIPFY